MELNINLKIENVRNIKHFDYKFSFEKGIYALVGENAVGKSTVMASIASTVYPRNIIKLDQSEVDLSSKITVECKENKDIWYFDDKQNRMKSNFAQVIFNGIYEGSLFSGTRFEDMTNIDKMISDDSFVRNFVDANSELKEALSYILHAEKGHYKKLYKLRNMAVAKSYSLNNMPYFYLLDSGKYISKFKMSSGECMLISLLNFIISTTSRPEQELHKKQTIDKRLFIFIDEVELALHPSSIDRLVEYLGGLVEHKNITVLFSTHSSELIRKMQPRNIFYLKNHKGITDIINPCYPQYAIRSLYDHDGYDCTILVEDKLSEIIIRRLISDFRVKNNLLINVLPVGTWGNTLALQKNIMEQNALGRDKFVFSIIDGDVEGDVKKCKEFENLKKLFLPIKSVEKYLYKKLIVDKDNEFIKIIGNKYFTLDPLESIIRAYEAKDYLKSDTTGKSLFKLLLEYLGKMKVKEEDFVKDFCEDLFVYENFNKLKISIEKFIQDNFYIKK